MSPVRSLASFLNNWKTTAAGIASLLVFVGADGKATAQRLDEHMNREMPALINAQAQRDRTQDDVAQEVLRTVRAMALSQCLKERNPVARLQLDCGAREREAGIR
jgi:hypothetical protein